MQILDITPKRYYSRSSRLLKIGIISRKNGVIILTSFGQLVYKAQSKIATAFSHSSELRMIGVIKSHSGMSDDEQKRIIDKILEDSELKNLGLREKECIVIYTNVICNEYYRHDNYKCNCITLNRAGARNITSVTVRKF